MNEEKMKLTKKWLIDQNPCSDGLKLSESCGFNFVKIWQTCQWGDWMIWLLRRANLLDKPSAVRIAVECADHVLNKFEQKYPEDKRPRKAIEAAIEWLNNPTDAAAAYASAAAYAADAAASAADAAASAAYAAYAADAADAAASAAYAAYAADAAAAYAAAYSERKWQADKIRELIPCPFEE